MKLDLSVVFIAKNEEHNMPKRISELEGISDIVVMDDGSTDNTVSIARELGARVIEVGDKFSDIRPTQEDIDGFTLKFGWEPNFNLESIFFREADARNHAASLAKNDWVYNPDADEETIWDLPAIRKLLTSCDQINYMFEHAPGLVLPRGKVYRQSAFSYVGSVHAVVINTRPTVVRSTDKMHVIHHQKENPLRGTETVKALEYAAIREGGPRHLFYLGREYHDLWQFEKSIAVLRVYLQEAAWRPEIAEAKLLISHCLWYLQRGDEARKECIEVIGMNPEFKEALNFMATMSWDREAVSWKRYAESATNDSVLFIRE